MYIKYFKEKFLKIANQMSILYNVNFSPGTSDVGRPHEDSVPEHYIFGDEDWGASPVKDPILIFGPYFKLFSEKNWKENQIL